LTVASPAAAAEAPSAPAAPDRGRALLQTAWWAIAVGCALEALVLLVALVFGKLDRPQPFVADLTQKVSWGMVVCVALAFGNTAAKSLRTVLTGTLGLLGAPAAFVVARALHRGVGQALGLVAGAAGGPPPALVATLKGLEYALLGAALAWLTARAAGVGRFAAVGLGVGAVFALVFHLLFATPGAALYPVVTRALNELLFPLGCSLAIYASTVLGRQLAR
jgi:hypothetical protein